MGVANFHGTILERIVSCFHSHASQSLFCLIICCIQQFHYLIILSNNLFCFRVDLFSIPKQKKKIQYKENKLSVFGWCTYTKLKIFLSPEKFLKWTSAFIVRKEKKYSIRANKFASRKPPLRQILLTECLPLWI